MGRKYAIFDTETTGLPLHRTVSLDKQPYIIEFGGIITDGEEIFEEIEFLVKPPIWITEEITKITGITNEDMIGLEMFDERVEKIAAFFSKADSVIAHNLAFDKKMVDFAVRREGLSLADVNWPKTEICTVEATYDRYGRRMKLQELYTMHVGELVQTHRAIDDVKMLFEVAKKVGVFQ